MAKYLEQLGLRCGIEIHQQLEGHKLFCRCPTEIREDEPDFRVKRKLRAVAGETGSVDKAAMQETARDRTFVYEGYKDTTCLVELDESPPQPINRKAFCVTLQVAKLLNARPVDRVHVMRKTVIDGSNTSGFQRTALIATGGSLELGSKTFGIPTIILEEESASTVAQDKGIVTYNLDRLGIPLLEIGTTPDIRTPTEAKDVAEALGLLLRSTGAMKRGLGTIRQDINVSIRQGARVEIKGAQDLRSLPLWVEYEARRQQALVEIRDALRKRRVKSIKDRARDVTGLMSYAGSEIVSKALRRGGIVLALRLKGFAGLLGREVQPGRRLGTEFSDRAKVIAGVGGIFHSDELPKYGITEHEVRAVRCALGCREKDGFAIVADDADRARMAMEAVIARAGEALNGVPSEVRKPNADGTSSYQRPLPGAARMYPETDIPPITITKEEFKGILVPERIRDKSQRYQKLGLGKDLADMTARSERAGLFEMFVKRYKRVKPAYIAEVIMTAPRAIRREKGIEIEPSEGDMADLFAALDRGEIAKESVLTILAENKPVATILQDYRIMPDAELVDALRAVIAKNRNAPFGALMGKAMAELRGKADGKKVMRLLKELTG